MTIADGIKKLVSMGLTLDQAVDAARVFEETPVDARRERNRRYYEAHKEERRPSEKRLKTSYSDDAGTHLKPSEKRLNSDAPPRAHVEDINLLSEIEPQQKEKKENKSRESTPKEILMGVLDEDTADAVMAHRRGKKSPLSTPLAARGLVKAFLEYPDGAQAAAEMMVTNGWTGFKRDYWEGSTRANGNRGSPPLRGLAAAAANLRQEILDDQRRESEEGGDHRPFDDVPLLAGPRR